jgi:molybdopterin-dependent oxidoreductase-like protein/molybdopterin-dependent oxidoreductase iron-sulfur protein
MTRSSHASVCPHDCPSACALEVTVDDGRIVDVVGDRAHPFTRGVICGKVHDYAERVYSPLRILHPMRRVGPKGGAEFERISWEDAIEEIAHRFTRVIAQWGGEAILPFSYAGTLGRIQYYAGHPLFHALGASQLDRTICTATAYAGWRATLGVVAGNDSEQMVGSDLVVLWGINAAYTHINLMTLVKEARARGARIICIDPYRTRTARQADQHLMIRSGTDGALALGLMHVLIREDLLDHGYIERATLGFEALREHVCAYPPERVAAITGLPADAIVDLARRYGRTKASYLRVGIGLSRHENGGMTCRAIACLPALTGAYAHPHGGALLGSSGTFGPGDTVLERRDLLPSPPPRTINMVQLGRALTDPDLRPPVMALYVYNSNPAAVCPNSSLVLKGLAREDLFTVVHEQVQTDTADYADLLLPATTSMEHTDFYRSFGHLYLQLAEPVILPRGEARTNWEVFGQLARAMGMRDRHYETPLPALVDAHLRAAGPVSDGITHARLLAERSARIAVPRPFLPFSGGWSSTPRPCANRGCPRCPRTCPFARAWTTLPSSRASPSAATCRRTGSSSTRRSANRRCSAHGRADRRCWSIPTTRPLGASGRGASSSCGTIGGGRSSRPSCRTTPGPARWWSRGSGGTSSCPAAGGSTRSPRTAWPTWAEVRHSTPRWSMSPRRTRRKPPSRDMPSTRPPEWEPGPAAWTLRGEVILGAPRPVRRHRRGRYINC